MHQNMQGFKIFDTDYKFYIIANYPSTIAIFTQNWLFI